METEKEVEAIKAIIAIVRRYHNILEEVAAVGASVRIMTPGTMRPDLIFRGDAAGRAQLAICTEEGERNVIFTRWPDGDRFFPENWPRQLPVPNYASDAMP